MIIIGFGCGLGNQMFQYAFYLSMLDKYSQIKIKADTQYAFVEEHNGFELEKVFGIKLQECSINERKKLSEIAVKKNFYTEAVLKIRNKLGIHKKSFYKQQDYTEYYPEVYNFPSNLDKYLLGVWGNEKYFQNMKERLQKEVFVFASPKLNDISRKIKRKIESVDNSVSIHVRRGDFVEYKNHIMGEVYYEKAMGLMEKKLGKVYYFIFSDDMGYAGKLFQESSNIFFVNGNGKEDSWMDMYLMSLCKNNIIANSSFSFWGAYLNLNINKVVIAPQIPFKNCKNAFTCEEWIMIDENIDNTYVKE